MTGHRGIFTAALTALGLIGATIGNAGAAVVITGAVGSSGKYLVSGLHEEPGWLRRPWFHFPVDRQCSRA
jgi:hypothetical protein